MTGTQAKELRLQLGFSARKAARLLGYADTSGMYYAEGYGDREVSPQIRDRYLRMAVVLRDRKRARKRPTP